MNREEIIDNIEKSMKIMETRVSSLENELHSINEETKNLIMNSSTSTSQITTNHVPAIFINRIQLLKDENKNLLKDLDESKMAYNEKFKECEKIRAECLSLQRITEEYRQQLESFISTTKDSSRKSDEQATNTNLIIVNERIKEQLNELGHLPFVLETKSLELEECNSKLKIAEKTISALSQDLETCIVKYELQQKAMEQEKIKQLQLQKELEKSQQEIVNWKNNYDEIEEENQFLLKNVEKLKFIEECLQKKSQEVLNLLQQIEMLNEEHSKQILRAKERADIQKRSFQTQINALEQQLVRLRADLSASYQEREELKLRLQSEKSKMEQKFNNTQLEIQNLKNHVEILKSTFTNVFEDLDLSSSDDDTITNDETFLNLYSNKQKNDLIDQNKNTTENESYAISKSFCEEFDTELTFRANS